MEFTEYNRCDLPEVKGCFILASFSCFPNIAVLCCDKIWLHCDHLYSSMVCDDTNDWQQNFRLFSSVQPLLVLFFRSCFTRSSFWQDAVRLSLCWKCTIDEEIKVPQRRNLIKNRGNASGTVLIGSILPAFAAFDVFNTEVI